MARKRKGMVSLGKCRRDLLIEDTPWAMNTCRSQIVHTPCRRTAILRWATTATTATTAAIGDLCRMQTSLGADYLFTGRSVSTGGSSVRERLFKYCAFAVFLLLLMLMLLLQARFGRV